MTSNLDASLCSGFERFERWSNSRFFKICADGRWAFFPQGPRGPGYELASDVERKKLRLKTLFLTTVGPGCAYIPAGAAFVMVGPGPVVLAIAALGAISFVGLGALWFRTTQSRLKPVEERLTLLQIREQRRGLMRLPHWLALAASALGVVLVTSSGVLWFGAGPKFGGVLASAGVAALFWGGWRLSRREPCPSA